MTRLLVSVRNAWEARIALSAGASLIDVQEPERGPLGPPEPRVVEEVTRVVAGTVPVSVALGELCDWDRSEWADFPRGVSYAKMGLAGCARHTDWFRHWHDVLAGLPAGVQPVAVLYADWLAAAAPPPGDILAASRANGCRAAVVDTFDKSRGHLMDWFTVHELASLVAGMRASGLVVVLAGSLSLDTIPEALCVEPDFIGVRGAACSRGRCGPLDPDRVRQLARLIESTSVIESSRTV
jgi:uncharacterized protein (UPF0264 family)